MTHLRGTVVANSIRTLRERGLMDAYEATQEPALAARLLSTVAMSWVPIEDVLPHYELLDRLVPSPAEHRAIGRDAATRLQGVYLRTLTGLLRASGALTVDRALPRVRSVLDRMVMGGTATVEKTGPKDADVILQDMPVLDTHYFRNNLAAWFETSFRLISRTTRASVTTNGEAGSAIIRLAWV